MPSVRAGNIPWYGAVPEFTKSGRMRKTLTAGDMEFDLSEGWHPKRPRGWKSKGKKTYIIRDGKAVPMVYDAKVKGVDGKEYTIYKTRGYDDFTGFTAHGEPDTNAMEYAQAAFDENSPGVNIVSQDGCGHIAKLEYSATYQVLRVTFTNNGAIAIFFRVPSTVAGELMHHAETGAVAYVDSDGTERHQLGVTFWTLVRIRGQVTGARYPFEYQKHGTYKLTRSNKRYKITLSDKNIKEILGPKYAGPLKPGDKVSAILSEQEYAKYRSLEDDFEHESAVLGVQRVSEINKDGETIEIELAGSNPYDQESMMRLRAQIEAAEKMGRTNAESPLTPEEQAKFNALKKQYTNANAVYQANVPNARLQEAMDKLQAIRAENPELMALYENAVLSGEISVGTLERELHSRANLDDMIDKRYRGDNIVYRKWVNKVHNLPAREAFSTEQEYLDYLYLGRKGDLNKHARRMLGRGWTKEQLAEKANAMAPGGIDAGFVHKYKQFVQNKDWEGALNFLMTHKGTVYDDHGNIIARQFYAGSNDFIDKGD